ncbi:hypothetical protein EX30DRAFT_130389 [Ascodesmis nigricans]|uniref:Secreted protein n=1 Tax=Ascodesmis nigricans TaxID=341454 RepID=A0A4S2MNT0_9PEZI|nr:hypothetical protein EX30DRAFT_130389 [Ascodesmis nigricans]
MSRGCWVLGVGCWVLQWVRVSVHHGIESGSPSRVSDTPLPFTPVDSAQTRYSGCDPIPVPVLQTLPPPIPRPFPRTPISGMACGITTHS